MIVEFEDFTLNTRTRSLCKHGTPAHLQPKVMDLLLVLIENHARYVSKHEIFAALWGDVHVENASLLRLVRELRRALGDQGSDPRFIRTLHARGYQFTGEVRVVADAAEVDQRRPAYDECAS